MPHMSFKSVRPELQQLYLTEASFLFISGSAIMAKFCDPGRYLSLYQPVNQDDLTNWAEDNFQTDSPHPS